MVVTTCCRDGLFLLVCVCVYVRVFVSDPSVFFSLFCLFLDLTVSCKVIYQTNRTISILFVIVIYNCKYIFSRQIFYCSILCAWHMTWGVWTSQLLNRSELRSVTVPNRRISSCAERLPQGNIEAQSAVTCTVWSGILSTSISISLCCLMSPLPCNNRPWIWGFDSTFSISEKYCCSFFFFYQYCADKNISSPRWTVTSANTVLLLCRVLVKL